MANQTELFYEDSYRSDGIDAQRRWPNEELCRFMGRNYFSIPRENRNELRILEVGCGSGANLRLLVDEGFDAYGIELSAEAVRLVSHLVLGTSNVKQGNMLSLEYPDNYFDGIVDIFSSYCLNEKEIRQFVNEVYSKLKVGGRFFSYTPAKDSDAWTNYLPSIKIDNSTLDGIKRETSPYYGNFYPFRFMSVEDIYLYFDTDRFKINYIEKIERTYRNMSERFVFLTYEVEKR